MLQGKSKDFMDRAKGANRHMFIDKKVLDIGGRCKEFFKDCDYTETKSKEYIHKLTGQYDVVVSIGELSFDGSWQKSLINMVKRLLKPEGLLVVTCAGFGCGKNNAENDFYKGFYPEELGGVISFNEVLDNFIIESVEWNQVVQFSGVKKKSWIDTDLEIKEPLWRKSGKPSNIKKDIVRSVGKK